MVWDVSGNLAVRGIVLPVGEWEVTASVSVGMSLVFNKYS
jgi:hypothetical protein